MSNTHRDNIKANLKRRKTIKGVATAKKAKVTESTRIEQLKGRGQVYWERAS